MKPKEFDELVRQKFDQNDFEYNPRNWEKLEEALDGRAKKRTVLMWWWMPLVGIAASVALAMAVIPSLSPSGNTNANGIATIKTLPAPQLNPTSDNGDGMLNAQQLAEPVQHSIAAGIFHNSKSHKNKHAKGTPPKAPGKDLFAIVYENAVGNSSSKPRKVQPFDFMGSSADKAAPKKAKKEYVLNEPVNTFKPQDEMKKAPKTSFLVTGGYNRGNANTGYSAGATIRHMVSAKMYIESDIAFTSSNNSQTNTVLTGYNPVQVAATPVTTAARSTNKTTYLSGKTTGTKTILEPEYGPQSQTYNLNYAQVSPGLGWKLMRKMTMGVGPDFQQMLADNRPVVSAALDRDNIQSAPLLDIGLIAKTEYSVSRNVKAGLSYRKGMNNVLTLMDKYIDRDYLQFQVKCAVFNK